MALADVEDILKHDYKDLHNLLNNSVGLCAQLDHNTDSLHGDFAVIALEVGREYGIGARLEGDVIPAAHSVAPKQVHVKVKRTLGRYRMTQAEIKAMETNVGAFIQAQPRRVKNLKDSATRDYARQTWGDGSGRIAQCGTTSNSTTVQLAATTAEQQLLNLAEGMQVDIGTNANPQLVAADRRVISVDFDNATIEISGTGVTTTGSNFVYRQGAGGDPGTDTQRELTGVANIVDDTAICETIDPADVWNWAALVFGNGSTLRPLSESTLESGVMRHEARTGAMVNELRAGLGTYRGMVNLLKGRQREVNKLALNGGHTAVDYTFGGHNLPLSYDRDADSLDQNSVWGFQWDSMKVYVQQDWGWEDLDGQILRLATDGTHAFEAIFYTFRELGVTERNKNFRFDDVETAA